MDSGMLPASKGATNSKYQVGRTGTTIPQTVEKWTFEGAVAEIQYLNVAQLVHVGGQCDESCVVI